VCGTRTGARFVDVRRLVRHHLIDGQPGRRRFERQRGARRQSDEAGAAPRRVDQGREIFHFARQRVRRRVAARAAAAAVVRDDSKPVRQQRRNPRRGAKDATAECAIHHNDRRSAAALVVGNLRPVQRCCFAHAVLRQGASARTRASRSINPPQINAAK
jgi:hypothetical protein